MLMKGEHGLLEYLYDLTVDIKLKFQRDADKECVFCTWWRPQATNEQPMLQVKKYVGSTLQGHHKTKVVFLKRWQPYAEHLWSLVPASSFLRCGLKKQETVLRFTVDELDALLENDTAI